MTRSLLFAILILAGGAWGQGLSHSVGFRAAASGRAATALTAPTIVKVWTNASASATTLTISSATISGSNPYLLVCEANNSSLSLRTVSSVTSGTGSQTLTNIIGTNLLAHGSNSIWGIGSPTTGDIVVTLSGAANAGLSVFAIQLTGCTSVGGAAASFSSSTRTNATDSVATVATDLVIDFLAGSASWTLGAGQTLVTNMVATIGCQSSSIAGSAGTTSMSQTNSSGTIVSHLALAAHGM